MQAMSQQQKEVECIANNMEKYITFSVGGLRFIESLNFLQGSLDSLVSATPKESLKITSTISKGSNFTKKGSTLTSTWTHERDSLRQGFWTKRSFTAS